MLGDLPNEAQAAITVCVFLAAAYLVLYPLVRPANVTRMALYDLGVTAGILLVNGWLFLGSGASFSLLLFDTNWWVFSLVIALILEVPLMMWFVKRHNIPME